MPLTEPKRAVSMGPSANPYAEAVCVCTALERSIRTMPHLPPTYTIPAMCGLTASETGVSSSVHSVLSDSARPPTHAHERQRVTEGSKQAVHNEHTQPQTPLTVGRVPHTDCIVRIICDEKGLSKG